MTIFVSVLLVVLVPVAQAREVYVANEAPGSVSVIDDQTNQVLGAPIKVGNDPGAIAITPDGRSAYVANAASGSVSVIDTQTNQVVGSAISVGSDPDAIAITPDGRRAYVVERGTEGVAVIDTQTNQVLGPLIHVGPDPSAIAITPDGARAFVVVEGGGDVAVINTETDLAVGTPIKVNAPSRGIAITPDGRTVYVVSESSKTVSAINTETDQVIGLPIPVGKEPTTIAITPDGASAYVANAGAGTVSVIDTETDQIVGSPITVGKGPGGVAITPDGRDVYVADKLAKSVSVIDTQTKQVISTPIVGEAPQGIAIVPDQTPLASFTAPSGIAGSPLTFASTSVDSDGTIATYAWSFGDGQSAIGGPTTTHIYSAPGTYQATLTLTDNDGCSTALLFSGQTALCNGSPLATSAAMVTVSGPPQPAAQEPLRIRLGCPKSAKPAGCAFKLQIVSAKPERSKGAKGKTKKPLPESAIAKAKLKAGHSALITLKPKSKFAGKLAAAGKVLVREVETVKGKTHTSYRNLKVVR